MKATIFGINAELTVDEFIELTYKLGLEDDEEDDNLYNYQQPIVIDIDSTGNIDDYIEKIIKALYDTDEWGN